MELPVAPPVAVARSAVLALVGCRVVRVTLDQQVCLGFAGHDALGRARVNATLAIDAPFSITQGSGEFLVVPGDAVGYGEAAGLLGRTVVRVRTDPDCTTVLDLDLRGLSVVVDAHPSYNAWELMGTGVRGVVMPPNHAWGDVGRGVPALSEGLLAERLRARRLGVEDTA